MTKGFFKVPAVVNEPVLNYAPGNNERKLLKEALNNAYADEADIPMYIGSEEVRTGVKKEIRPPPFASACVSHVRLCYIFLL
jgi:1-pyrroline-5-carboxylate dehydrogenase